MMVSSGRHRVALRDGERRGANFRGLKDRGGTSDPPNTANENMKTIVIILAIACVALAGTMVFHRAQIHQRLTTLESELGTATNDLSTTAGKLAESEKLGGFLQKNLDQRGSELAAASNELAKAGATLATVQGELQSAQAAAKSAQAAAKLAQDDATAKGARVAQLESEKDEMTKKLTELAGQINSLEDQITSTRQKLASAEGDRAYLTKELARLQNDKAELVRQFNDLAVLRAQVAMLKEEAAINQRIAWMNQGIYSAAGRKGAEVLVARPGQTVRPDPGLNVEVEKTGGARVVPKASSPQNP
jgi:myosin heavy subunit